MSYRDKYFSKQGELDNNNGWYKCIKCGRNFRKGDMDIDHIIPQKYGGPDSMLNLQCICKHCNRSKKANMADTPMDLFKSLGREMKRKRLERETLRSPFTDDDEDIINYINDDE